MKSLRVLLMAVMTAMVACTRTHVNSAVAVYVLAIVRDEMAVPITGARVRLKTFSPAREIPLCVTGGDGECQAQKIIRTEWNNYRGPFGLHSTRDERVSITASVGRWSATKNHSFASSRHGEMRLVSRLTIVGFRCASNASP